MKDVNLAEMYEHIFKLVNENRFIVYEYVKNKINDFFNINIDFFKELTDYVRFNDFKEIVEL